MRRPRNEPIAAHETEQGVGRAPPRLLAMKLAQAPANELWCTCVISGRNVLENHLYAFFEHSRRGFK